MQPITAYRETHIELPWAVCTRQLAAILTSEDWSSERKTLVGRTNHHFVIAVRRMEAAHESLLFRLIADSPELRHPLTGYVEVRPASGSATAMTVMLTANLDDDPAHVHLSVRESIASLADVLSRTIE